MGILASSVGQEDNSMPVIRKIQQDFDPECRVMKKLSTLSKAVDQNKESSSSRLTIVDDIGRVLATSKVSSPTEVRRKVSESSHQQNIMQDQHKVASAWLQLRKISRNMETMRSQD